MQGKISTRGLLIHATHYDPNWCKKKDKEEPFDPDVGCQIVDAMAAHNMNLLVIDCEDGVRYRSHPELTRKYTVPMAALKQLAAYAHQHNIDVVPKLNFSKSGRAWHDDWMAPHAIHASGVCVPDESGYWDIADELICELVEVCRPKTFFHVGMDEDHDRSLTQYVAAIHLLRRLVAKHGLRTVIWNDSCHFKKTGVAQVYAEKCRDAEEHLPRDIVQVAWAYGRAHPAVVKRIAQRGFTVWGAPGLDPRKVKNWRRAVVANGGAGLLMTRWIKCSKRNRRELLDLITELAPLYV
jgi:hypothetical protein